MTLLYSISARLWEGTGASADDLIFNATCMAASSHLFYGSVLRTRRCEVNCRCLTKAEGVALQSRQGDVESVLVCVSIDSDGLKDRHFTDIKAFFRTTSFTVHLGSHWPTLSDRHLAQHWYLWLILLRNCMEVNYHPFVFRSMTGVRVRVNFIPTTICNNNRCVCVCACVRYQFKIKYLNDALTILWIHLQALFERQWIIIWLLILEKNILIRYKTWIRN
jgi:hypothetical protein